MILIVTFTYLIQYRNVFWCSALPRLLIELRVEEGIVGQALA